MKEETILAIDYGTRRLGLAISRGSLADPLSIVENNESLFYTLKKVCDEEGVTRLLVGISENEMAENSKTFGEKVSELLNLPVEYFDETLSSHQVHQQQKALGKSGPRRDHIDHLAAATFLQEWLDLQ